MNNTIEIHPYDIHTKTYRSNKSGWCLGPENGVELTHFPTEITVRCHTERSAHANKAKALDMLIGEVKALYRKRMEETKKPTLDVSRKQLFKLINARLDLIFNTAIPSTNAYIDGVIDLLSEYVEFGSPTIAVGSRVQIIQGFSKGSKGTVIFAEPSTMPDRKFWITRDGDSGPKYWMRHELELISE